MKIHYCEQGTQERLELKRGMMSSSKADAIGNCGSGLDTLVENLAPDRIAKRMGISGMKNAYTDHGHEHEPTARGLAELEKGYTVTEVGFVQYDDYSGSSPDGVIFDGDNIDGLVEIKCQDNKAHLKTLLTQKAESKYIWQMQHQMLVTGAKWCDFVAYNPNFEQSLFILRYFPDLDMQAKLKEGIRLGTEKIQKIESDFNLLYKN